MIEEQSTAARQGFQQGLSSTSSSAALWVLIALFVLGLASLAYGLSNKTVQPDFALFTASLLFLMDKGRRQQIVRTTFASWNT